MGRKPIAFRGFLLVEAIIDNELPLGSDQEIVGRNELIIFGAKHRCIRIGLGIAVAPSEGLFLLLILLEFGQKRCLDFLDGSHGALRGRCLLDDLVQFVHLFFDSLAREGRVVAEFF